MNLLAQIKARTSEIATSNRSAFNTNDFLLENLLDKKIKRSDVIDMIIAKRMEILGINADTKDLDAQIDKLYKTSKNGLDTAVSSSNNNSSFNYNAKYEGYDLIKEGSMLSIVKSKTSKKS